MFKKPLSQYGVKSKPLSLRFRTIIRAIDHCRNITAAGLARICSRSKFTLHLPLCESILGIISGILQCSDSCFFNLFLRSTLKGIGGQYHAFHHRKTESKFTEITQPTVRHRNKPLQDHVQADDYRFILFLFDALNDCQIYLPQTRKTFRTMGRNIAFAQILESLISKVISVAPLLIELRCPCAGKTTVGSLPSTVICKPL